MKSKIVFLVSVITLSTIAFSFITPVQAVSDTDSEKIFSDSNGNGEHDPGEVLWEVVRTTVSADIDPETSCFTTHDHDHIGHNPANGVVDAILITAKFGVFHTDHDLISQITTDSQSQFENEDSYESQFGYTAFKIADLNIGASTTKTTEAEITTECKQRQSDSSTDSSNIFHINSFNTTRYEQEFNTRYEQDKSTYSVEKINKNAQIENSSELVGEKTKYSVSSNMGGSLNNVSSIIIKIQEIDNKTDNASLSNTIQFANGSTNQFNTTIDLTTGTGNNSTGFLIPANLSIGDTVLDGANIVDIKNESFLEQNRTVIKIEQVFRNSFGNITARYNATFDNETRIMIDTEVMVKGLNTTGMIEWNIEEASWIKKEQKLDIKPCSNPNAINPDSKGLIPVAIKHTGNLNPIEKTDVNTLRFGAADAVENGNGASPAHNGHSEDVVPCEGDGKNDLVLHFATQNTGLDGDEDNGRLKGETKDGTKLFGEDSVKIVGGVNGNNGNGQP